MALLSWLLPLRPSRRIYLDYASAPPVRSEALAAMHAAEQYIGNPGAIHREAVEAKKSLEISREAIARILGVKAREVIFTAGLTDANNLGILGYARALERTRRTFAGTHWVVSSIEHASVLECFAEIERLGGEVAHIDPDHRGIVTAESLKHVLKKETVLVSIGWANNELGTIQPLREISALIHAHEHAQGTSVMLHTDAGQAPLYLATTLHSLGVDLCALGSNKLYGPHGIGALYISNRAEIARVAFGGKQERGLRPGTENVALAAGFAASFECAAKEREAEEKRLRALRDDLAAQLRAAIPGLIVNGDLAHALPHMLNVSIPEVSSEYVTLALDHAGIAVSTKSACREGEESESHAVAALGRSPTGETLGGEPWVARNTLRFSLGRDTRASDIPVVVKAVKSFVHPQV